MSNLAVNADAPRRGFARLLRAGYLARQGAMQNVRPIPALRWYLPGDYNPAQFFAAMRCFLQRPSILYIDSVNPCREAEAFYSANALQGPYVPPCLELLDGEGKHHRVQLPFTDSVLTTLTSFAQRYYHLEFADAVQLFDLHVWLRAASFGHAPIEIDRAVPAHAVSLFAAPLGGLFFESLEALHAP